MCKMVQQAALGDAWWDLASANDDAAKQQLEARAAHWYRQALPHLTGLAAEKVAKRLEEPASSASVGTPDRESPSPLAGTIVGHFQIGMLKTRTKQRKVAFWEFREDHSVWEKERRIAEWTATDSRVRLAFSDKTLGEATIRLRRRGVFLGQWIPANGDVWACEFQKVFVVSVWEYHWGNESNTRKLSFKGRNQYGLSIWGRLISQ